MDNRWFAVGTLGFAVFVFNTSEFAPVGLLTEISKGINETEAKTGLLLTYYAWTVAVMSLPMTILTARLERKRLLLTLIAFFILGNLLVTLFKSFIPVLFARLVIALCHSIFWSITPSLAVRLAPKPALGLGLIAAGTAVASVLGMPLCTFIGQQLTWRAAFWLLSAASLAAAATLYLKLPETPSKNSGSLRSLPEIFQNTPLLLSYLATALFVTGQFTIYSYLVPYLRTEARLSDNAIVYTLFLYGLSGAIGIFITNRYMEGYLRRLNRGAFAVVIAMIALQGVVKHNVFLLGFTFVMWSAALSVFGICMQSHILKLAPKTTDTAMSIYSGIFNVGIGGGAFIGSRILSLADTSLLTYAAALIALPGLITIVFVSKIIKNEV